MQTFYFIEERVFILKVSSSYKCVLDKQQLEYESKIEFVNLRKQIGMISAKISVSFAFIYMSKVLEWVVLVF